MGGSKLIFVRSPRFLRLVLMEEMAESDAKAGWL